MMKKQINSETSCITHSENILSGSGLEQSEMYLGGQYHTVKKQNF